MRVTVIPVVLEQSTMVLKVGDEQFKSKWESRSSIVKLGQNTEKSPGNLRKFAVTQTPVKNHQLALVK